MNKAEQITFLRARIDRVHKAIKDIAVRGQSFDENIMLDILINQQQALMFELELHYATLKSLTDGDG